jgi:hypothetical protein
MRERIPHDYLALLGIAGVLTGLLFPLNVFAGLIALGIWIIIAIVLFVKYR